MKIFDCLMFNNEFDLLFIAFQELSGIDVSHVIVQGDKTFTGKQKKMLVPANFFSKSKVIVLEINMPTDPDPWVLERFQRNAIMRGLVDAKDDDLIIIRDADEVPSAAAIKAYNPGNGVSSLVMDKFGYWLNCREGIQSWSRAKIMTYGYLKNTTPDEVRNAGQDSIISNAGWHWSWLGDVNRLVEKFNSFSHQELNNDKWANPEKLKYKIETGQSLWGEDFWQFISIDETFPKYVQDHQHDSLKNLIKQI